MQEQWLSTVTEKITTRDFHTIPETEEEMEQKLESLGLSEAQIERIVDMLQDQELFGYDRGRASMGEESYVARRRRLGIELASRKAANYGTA